MTTSSFPGKEQRLAVLSTAAAALLSLLVTAAMVYILTSAAGSSLPVPFSAWTVSPPLVEEIMPLAPAAQATPPPAPAPAQTAPVDNPALATVAGVSVAPAASPGDSVSDEGDDSRGSGGDDAVAAKRDGHEEEERREHDD
ncbi:MAG: hypothetical protein C4534_10755 [Gaiellales bacterium]|nr:MAG: hypothetical protein C4534_10755 [Gaiellales bacterium]